MNALSRSATLLTAGINLATWLLARAVNMPEPLLQHTGVYVFAQVQAAENRVDKSLCPMPLLRQIQSFFRRPLG